MSDTRLTSTELGRLGALALLVALLAVLPYLDGLQGDFVFDDTFVIRDNPMITGESASVVGLFTTVYNPGTLYRPLAMVTYLVNARLGAGVVGYHVVNVGLHALVTVAAFFLAWRLLGSVFGATVTAALFAVHPIHTEAVTSIVGRAELLAALFVLVSLLAFIRALRPAPRRLGWLALSVAAFMLACLSKESGFVGIPLCGIVYVWCGRGVRGLRSAGMMAIPYVLVGVGYLAWRMWLIGSLTLPEAPSVVDNPLAHVPLLPRLETAVVILWQYLSALAVPLRLAADYSFNEVPVVASVFDFRFVAAGILFALLAMVVGLSARRVPAMALGAAFMIASLSLTANILFPIGTIKADRLLYLPSFGWCLALAALLMSVPASRRSQAMALVGIVVIAYAGRTWVRNRDWRDNTTLFTAAVQTAPRSSRAHYDLAIAYEKRGETEAAMHHFREALAIYSLDADTAFGIGRIYDKKGLEREALEWYTRATELNWRTADAHLNIGAIHYRHGEYGAAEAAFRAGLESDPSNARLLVGLSLVLWGEGDRDQARVLLARVEALRDARPEIVTLLAQARSLMEGEVAR